MQARDAAGRQVSLLNDDNSCEVERARHQHCLSFQFSSTRQPLYRPPVSRSGSSSPAPELFRSDSYDSQMSNDTPISPPTPSVDFFNVRGPVYDYGTTTAAAAAGISSSSSDGGGGGGGGGPDALPAKRPAYVDTRRSASCEEDSSAASSVPERPSKRYPCRYRNSHGCEKTFTTSGHASRHAKIHTAEKAVQCTHQGCHKKFTRADNMKQHLETHYKDKTRSSSSAVRASKAALTDARRNSGSSSRSRVREAASCWVVPFPNGGAATAPTTTTTLGASWGSLELPLLNRPVTESNPPRTGLDALALAIECQESGRT